MSQGIDLLRSWIRAAADRTVHHLSAKPVVRAGRQAVQRLLQRTSRITDEILTAAAAHAEGVESAMVSCRTGRIHVHASLSSGADVNFSLAPISVRFAPRGAKEVAFGVEPPGGSNSSIVAALAGCIAQAAWPMAMPQRTNDLGGAIVERESPERIRVDLRTVPAIRRFAAARGAAAMILEMLEVESLQVEPGALSLKLKLPAMGA
jgi:hypothetical protein